LIGLYQLKSQLQAVDKPISAEIAAAVDSSTLAVGSVTTA